MNMNIFNTTPKFYNMVTRGISSDKNTSLWPHQAIISTSQTLHFFGGLVLEVVVLTKIYPDKSHC